MKGKEKIDLKSWIAMVNFHACVFPQCLLGTVVPSNCGFRRCLNNCFVNVHVCGITTRITDRQSFYGKRRLEGMSGFIGCTTIKHGSL